MDPGISIFKKLSEYPSLFLQRWLSIARWTHDRTHGKTWITIPDYPDDENPGLTGDNVGRTLNNIKWFIKKDDSLPWLAVLQAKYLNPFSFFESCERTKELLGDFPRIGIGTVCKTRKLDFIEYCCKVARTFFPTSSIHAFGLTLSAIPRVKDIINSFDSLACNFPRQQFAEWSRTTGLKPFPNARPISKKVEPWFDAYVERLSKLLEVA